MTMFWVELSVREGSEIGVDSSGLPRSFEVHLAGPDQTLLFLQERAYSETHYN